MKTHRETIEVRTREKGPRRADERGRAAFTDATAAIAAVVSRSGIRDGIVTVFLMHTSASLVIQENADPRVLDDLDAWMRRAVPESDRYTHDDEGPDDMPSHIKSAITKTSETIPVASGALSLGTWQALYVWEHRDRPHGRKLAVCVLGV